MSGKLAKDLARNGCYGITESGPVDTACRIEDETGSSLPLSPDENRQPAAAIENENRQDRESGPVDVFMRLDAVMRATGLGRSTIYALMAAGLFPRPVKIGFGKSVAWSAIEVGQWQRARIAARDAR
jgi:prophage regulatory protein